MRKLSAFIDCFLLLIISAYAADTVKLHCEDKEVLAGSEVGVSVEITENPGFSAVWLTPTYDKSLFEIKEVSSELMDYFEKGINYIWAKEEGANVTSLGALCTLKIKVKDGALPGNYTVKLTPYECFNADEEPVGINEVSFIIRVSNHSTLSSFVIDKTEVTVDGSAAATASLTAKDANGTVLTGVAFSVSPADKGVTVSADGTVTVAANAEAGEYVFTATPNGTTVSGEPLSSSVFKVYRTAPYTKTVIISGGQSEIILPVPGGAAVTAAAFEAKVYDQYGIEMNETVTWTIDPAVAGASVSAGAVTITDAASVGAVTVKATAGTASATAAVSVVKAASVATSIIISGGQNEAEVPAAENSPAALTPFTATVYNQYGDEMSASVSWSIEPSFFGVSISDGAVTVTDKATTGSFTVKAATGSLFDTASVSLTDNTFDLPVSETEPQIFIESITADVGNTVTVNVYIKNNPGIAGLTLTPFFPEELILTNAKNGDLFSSFQKGVNYVWASSENVTSDGKLMTLSFSIPEGTSPGEYKLRLKLRKCYDSDRQDVTLKVSSGSVTVEALFIYGDVNTDGEVDIIDAIRLVKYLAGSVQLTDIQLKAANVNKDNEVDIIDAIRIVKYLAGVIESFD